MLIDWVVELDQKNRKIFKYIRTIFCTLLRFWKLHYVKLEAILKKLQGSFEEEVGELKYGRKPSSCELSKSKIEHLMSSQIRCHGN